MTTSKMNPKVDGFFRKAKQWQAEMEKLRAIVLGCGLVEDLKWGKPCYAVDGKNVVVIQPFKAYCALLFFKGFLMKDPDGVLVKTGENARVGRQIRFTDVRDIVKQAAVLKKYILQAVELEKSGVKAEAPTAQIKVPQELKNKLAEDAAFKTAFEALTPGRQRGYIFYFSGAKQSTTRESRIEKCAPQIFKGKGFNE